MCRMHKQLSEGVCRGLGPIGVSEWDWFRPQYNSGFVVVEVAGVRIV